jgi:hypothetical protein
MKPVRNPPAPADGAILPSPCSCCGFDSCTRKYIIFIVLYLLTVAAIITRSYLSIFSQDRVRTDVQTQ